MAGNAASLIAFESSALWASMSPPGSKGAGTPAKLRADLRIAVLRGALVDGERRERHRRVDVDRQIGDAARLHQAPQRQQHHLGAVDRERRDHDRAAPLRGTHDRVGEALERRGVVVAPVPVGGLDDAGRDGVRRLGRQQDLVLRAAEIAGEEQRVVGVAVDVDAHPRRAEDVAGPPEAWRARPAPPRSACRTAPAGVAAAPPARRPRCRAAARACVSRSPCGWRRPRPLPASARCRAARSRRAPRVLGVQ